MCYGKPEYWPTPDPVTYNRYLDALTDFTNWLIQRGYRILLFVSARYDLVATEDLKDRLRERHGQETLTHLVEPSISCVDELLREVSEQSSLLQLASTASCCPIFCSNPSLRYRGTGRLTLIWKTFSS